MPKTSLSHPLQIATLAAGAGRLGVTFCPGKCQAGAWTGDWARDLDTDLQALRDWGATHLVTMIEDHEFIELQVPDLGARAQAAGLAWFHLPIRDTRAPDDRFQRAWPAVEAQLLQALADGGGVVVHCKGGLGRAGTVAVRLQLALDPELTPDAAIARTRAVRPGAVETPEQEQYLRALRP